MRISKRLKTISEFIDKEDKIIDIGCDHALLDIYIKENIKSTVKGDGTYSLVEGENIINITVASESGNDI